MSEKLGSVNGRGFFRPLVVLFTYLVAAAWSFWRWEPARAFIYDRVFRMLDSPEWSSYIADYGVPTALVAVGSLLFWRTTQGKQWPDHLSQLNPFNRSISLFEAATLAYEKTKDKPISIIAETWANSGNDILIWYCDALTRFQNGKSPLIALYGNHPSSRDKEEIYMAPLNNYEFLIENNVVVLQARTGPTRYENLSVRSSDLPAAIAELESREV